MAEQERFHVFATSRIGDAAERLLRARGYDLEVFQGPEAPPKKLIIDKVKIREAHSRGLSLRRIGEEFGISRTLPMNLLRG